MDGAFGVEMEAMLRAGTGLVVALVGPSGEPCAVRGLALTVLDRPSRRLRVLIGGDDPDLPTFAGSTHVAVTGADVSTLRCVQVKGRVLRIEAATPDDEPVIAEHVEAFLHAIGRADGHSADTVRRMMPQRAVAIELVADEVYDQTPGPAAGRALTFGP